MADDQEKYAGGRSSGRVWAGLFLLLIGGILFVNQMGVPLPDWLFSWHVLLIVIGLFIGLRQNFRGGAWAILMLIGGFFLVQEHFPEIPLRRFMWPVILISLGLVFIFSPHRQFSCKHRRRKQQLTDNAPIDYSGRYGPDGKTLEDFVDSSAIFGGVHKKVVSKNFKGGDITSIMGGTELDLSQAEIHGVVRLDVTSIMGGTKIIVPAHWEVRVEVSAMFAGFEDKRQRPIVNNPEKILIIDGTSLFGGIELKNY